MPSKKKTTVSSNPPPPLSDEAIATLNAIIEKVTANPELLKKPKYASLRNFVLKVSKSPDFVSEFSAEKKKPKGLDENYVVVAQDRDESDKDDASADDSEEGQEDCKIL
jgi:hypothetical protein